MTAIHRMLDNTRRIETDLVDFCRRWRIRELALFGSILRPDFGASSDVDLLVTFAGDAKWSLIDHVQMKNELEALLGRTADLVTKRAVEQSSNWMRRRDILDSMQVVFSADEVVRAAR